MSPREIDLTKYNVLMSFLFNPNSFDTHILIDVYTVQMIW